MNSELPRYSSIDQILGDSRSRFFGAGFRQVRQNVLDVRIDAREKTVKATANIVYPPSWSSKRSRALQPHLSSIDALAIFAQICEMYLRESYGIEGLAADKMWIRRCVLKAGNTPTLDLDAVPAVCTLTKTEAAGDSLCGHLSHFTGRVGSMGMELVIDHPIVAHWDAVVHHPNAVDLLGPQEQRYFGMAFAETGLNLYDVELNPGANSARALLDLENPASMPKLHGLCAAYVPFVSNMNAIVSVAQLAQALLYSYDNITREASNNLWMRKIAIDSKVPVAPSRAMQIETWCTKSTLLPIKDTLWRTSNFTVTMPGIEADYSLAHQLPSNAQ